MKSISTVFKSGYGPSSSHTVGPSIAARIINSKYPDRDKVEVNLYGSLALTGKGHGTDKAIKQYLEDAEVIFDLGKIALLHPNTMIFNIFKDNEIVAQETVLSIGGGDIKILNEDYNPKEVYPQKNFAEVLEECRKFNISLPEFIYKMEGEGIKEELKEKWHKMCECIERGLNTTGYLPGSLHLERKAKMLYEMKVKNEDQTAKEDRIICSYAYAVSEENAAGNLVVIAPTCGAAGIVPAVLYYMQKDKNYPEEEIIDALAVAGMIGNVIRTNASISGAECGCQAECGSACSMAAAAIAQLNNLNLEQIEYAAEVAMEHHLGLTCDPVSGYVQIPCIERNAVAAMRAINSVHLAKFLYKGRRVSFDAVVDTMYKTGCDLSEKYRETSEGGLASLYK